MIGEESSARPLVKSKTDSVHVVADIRKFPTGKKSDSTVRKYHNCYINSLTCTCTSQ